MPDDEVMSTTARLRRAEAALVRVLETIDHHRCTIEDPKTRVAVIKSWSGLGRQVRAAVTGSEVLSAYDERLARERAEQRLALAEQRCERLGDANVALGRELAEARAGRP